MIHSVTDAGILAQAGPETDPQNDMWTTGIACRIRASAGEFPFILYFILFPGKRFPVLLLAYDACRP